MATVEELQGIAAGLTAIVKQQAEAQKPTNTQIANLIEALLGFTVISFHSQVVLINNFTMHCGTM